MPKRGLAAAGARLTDAYATAVFAMGLDGLRWLASGPRSAEYAAAAITEDDRVLWTEGMERYLVRGA